MFHHPEGLHGRSREAPGGIEIPSLPTGEELEEYLLTDTSSLKLVSDYTGLNFNEVIELDCITFKMLVRDAFIDRMSQTEDGRDYLEQCWILKQTEPDTAKLKKITTEKR
jgi:hypothetical protein